MCSLLLVNKYILYEAVVLCFPLPVPEITILVVKNIFSGLCELLSGADEKQELSTLAESYCISLKK